MAAPKYPKTHYVLRVVIAFDDKITGKQTTQKIRTAAGTYNYAVNGRTCGTEMVYKTLISAGVPPGNPYMDIFFAPGTEEEADKELPSVTDQFGADVIIMFDNKTRGFELDEDTISYEKRKSQSGEYEYFINRIQCRPKDMRELLVEAGFPPGSPVYDILLGE